VTTTYVIGAGASRYAKYPLASEMGQGLINFMLRMDQRPYASIQARRLIEHQRRGIASVSEATEKVLVRGALVAG